MLASPETKIKRTNHSSALSHRTCPYLQNHFSRVNTASWNKGSKIRPKEKKFGLSFCRFWKCKATFIEHSLQFSCRVSEKINECHVTKSPHAAMKIYPLRLHFQKELGDNAAFPAHLLNLMCTVVCTKN